MAASSTSFSKGAKGGRGGARPGAGRKPAAIQKYREKLGDNWDEMVAAMMKLTKHKSARLRFDALRFCMEHVIGKAPQSIKVENKDGTDLIGEYNEIKQAHLQNLGARAAKGTLSEP